MGHTTPQHITATIMAACNSICGGTPRYIESTPAPDSRPSFCFSNVAAHVKIHGGQIAYGWAIWHVPGLYLEAEHHGVWRKDADTLIDISPQFNNPPRILFLPDQSAVFDPDKLRQNRFFADGETAVAIEYVRLAQHRVDMLNRHRSADTSEVALPPAEQAEADAILTRLCELQAQHLSSVSDSLAAQEQL